MKALIISGSLLLLSVAVFSQHREVEKAIEKKNYDKYGKPGEDKLNEWLGGNLMNVTPEAEYKFPVSVSQHIVTYDNGKVKSENDIKYYINTDKLSFAMDGNQMNESSKSKKKSSTNMITVYDNINSAMLMFNMDQKSLFAMNINAFRSKASQEAAKYPTDNSSKNSDVSCNKTGKTKTILGYSCYEYVCKKKDSDSYTAMWVNSEVKIPDMPYMAGGRMPASFGKSNGIAGAVLEVDTYEKDELKTSMTVTEINKNADLLLVTADFKRQDLGTIKFGD